MKQLIFFGASCILAGNFAISTASAHATNTIFRTNNPITHIFKKINYQVGSASQTTIDFNSALAEPPEKILRMFHRDFPGVQNPTFYHFDDSYMVDFKDNKADIAYRIYYKNNGDILQTIKYYGAENLTPFIRSKVNLKYKDKTISSVTDITNETGRFYQIYQIALEDTKSWVYIKVNDNGSMQVIKRLRKQK